MINLQMLDVAIGLVFIYLLLSLVCSALKEWVAHLLQWRSVHLEQGIVDLLRHSGNEGLSTQFLNHPMIRGLVDEKSKASFIPSRTFSLVLLDLVAPADGKPTPVESIRSAIDALPEGSDLRKNLTILLDDAGHSLDEFKKNVETWFDQSMDRVSTIYQRSSRKAVIIIALLVTIFSNADTLQIADDLVNNPALRASIASQAEYYIDPGDIALDKNRFDEQLDEARSSIRSLGIPLGWDELPTGLAWLNKILGILITTLAISLGAPFWYDILGKVVTIRSAGRQKIKR